MTDQNVPYETIFNATSEGFVLCDVIVDERGKLIDYTVAQTNPAVQKMLGVGPDIHGKRLNETEFYSPVWVALCGDETLLVPDVLRIKTTNPKPIAVRRRPVSTAPRS